ncbi:putative short-chain dehydrogenase [Lindgomyces ingoldianus]|uniref:Short-chain dehydrogenase n=1 Tax=Lindgomyces ingoldianus TaxID=673940 RepID=A0ACB6R0D2_9PLEO|nr:putative short-chain dehydrogenase [Lindgomyces ingoldianus]KAF2472601.1 putative short-chain dehydrogenase [Lindgomyces ingoldianus]
MSTPVLFVLGAGPKIGLSVANSFAAKGYKVALAARSFQDGIGEDGYLRLKLDLANTADVEKAFAKVKEAFGIPSVVVYNGAEQVARDPQDPLDGIILEDVNREFAVNAISPLFTAQEAVKGFKQLPSSASRTFIMTGNKLNVFVMPSVLTFGMGKASAAHMVWYASTVYKQQGFKFYYVDERQADGSPTIPVGGPAAGKLYVELAEGKEQGPWDYTFVDGQGYVEFKEP